MFTTILIAVSWIVFSFLVACLTAKGDIRRRDVAISNLRMENKKLRAINDYQCNQIDQLIDIAKDQNEVLNRFVNILDELKPGVETTEYLVKAVLKNQYNKKSGGGKNESRKKT